MSSQRIESVLAICKKYNKLPSEVIGIEDDEYTAFCFNEACTFIAEKLEQNEKPRYRSEEKEEKKIKFNSFTELYNSIEK